MHNFENVGNEAAELVNQIDAMRSSGNYAGAQAFIEQNAEVLKKYIVDAITFRTWEEEIYNTQVYAQQVQQSVYFGDTKPTCLEGDVWISGGGDYVV